MRSHQDRAAHKAALAVLGLPEDARPADVTAAFRHLVRTHHPDTSETTPETSARFTAICDAYHVLTGRDPAEEGGPPPSPARHPSASRSPELHQPHAPRSATPPAPNDVTDAQPWLVAGPVRVEPLDADDDGGAP